MAPRSQKADVRPISFRLDDGSGQITTLPLVIRPEELTHAQTSLQTPVQTLNGAFLDDFGEGLASIQISGHTGWGAGKRPSGEAEFKKLHDAVWTKWRAARIQAVKQNRNPSNVRLLFVDDLDSLCVLVAPGQFQLKRSKSRPLLFMYSVSMTVLSDQVQPPPTDSYKPGVPGAASTVQKGIASLQSSINKLKDQAAKARTFVDANLVKPMQAMILTATGAMQNVVDLATAARGIVTDEVDQFSGIAGDLALLGRNAFYTYNAIAGLGDFASHEVSTVAAEFNNAFCVIANAFRKQREYPDFDGVYGASNCSSTTGGSPISPLIGTNPFETILPVPAMTAAVTPAARAQMDILRATDPVLAPMSAGQLSSVVAAIVAGVSVA